MGKEQTRTVTDDSPLLASIFSLTIPSPSSFTNPPSIFEVVDSDSKITYIQNQVVGPPANETVPGQEVNGSVICPLGSGLVNKTIFESYQAGTLFLGGNGTSSNGTKEYGSGSA